MAALVFILPTSGPRTYRGKYPNRARMVSLGTIGLHVELNDGTRLWTAKPRDHFTDLPPCGHNMAGFLAKAVPMTDSQYGELKAASELLATRAQIAGHGRRARLEETVRAMVNRIGAEIVSEELDSGLIDPLGAMRGTGEIAPLRLRQLRGPDGQSVLVADSGTVDSYDTMRAKADKLIDAMATLAGQLESEGNNSAARLLHDARCALNTLNTRDAARLADIIATHPTKAEALEALTIAANETAHCVPAGMARDELDSAIAGGFAALGGKA